MSESKFTSFLSQFRLLKEKHDAIAAATGARFNIFSVLDRERREVTTHSRFLAEFLNPKGTHSQGVIFLRLFVQMMGEFFPAYKSDSAKFSWDLGDIELGAFSVFAEAGTDGLGRIDILIESGEKCIVIENKIYAGDQERQLGRYYEYARCKNFAPEDIALIYLTREGDEPDEYTLSGRKSGELKYPLAKEKVLCVSYAEHIVRWVDSCMKESLRLPHIRETLFQYQMLLKQLTGQTVGQEFIVKSNEIFFEGKNYQLISDLEGAIVAFKGEVKRLLWEKIFELLVPVFARVKKSGDGENELFEKTVIDDAWAKAVDICAWLKRNQYVYFEFPIWESGAIRVELCLVDHPQGVYYSLFIQDKNNGEWVADYRNEEWGRYVTAAQNIKINSGGKMSLQPWCLARSPTYVNMTNQAHLEEMACQKTRDAKAQEFVGDVETTITALRGKLADMREQ